jgi:signal transduction histidine kinase/ActR/RegA family two-component response regulator
MSDTSPEAVFDRTAGDPLRAVRARVLRSALAILAIAVPAVAVIVVVADLAGHRFNAIAAVLAAYTLTFPLLWLLRRRLGHRRSAISLLALLALTAFLVEARGGVAAGSILVDALALTLGAVFFGRRGALFAWAAVVGLFVLAAAIVLGRVGPPIPVLMWDPTRPAYWVREVVGLGLLATALVVVQVYVIERLATETRRLEQLAESERRQRETLEQLEHDREREREQRLQTLKALEESRKIEALARLAGGIAHDFNNALTVIMGAASEIGAGTAPADNEAHARAILESAQHGAELTRSLLALGHAQVGKARPVSMAAFLDRLAPAFRRVLPADVTLDVEVAPGGTNVEVDPGGLERALLNLVINARDAMPRGGRLSIRCAAAEEGDHPGVAITVSDSGVGMAPDMVAHIFDPFFTTKSPGQGSGLGLATVRAFVEEARGTVQVGSVPGEGTTFTLMLPGLRSGSVPAEEAEGPGAAETQQAAVARVLLVEDHDPVRASMARALTRAGFLVTQAADGDQAVAILDRPGAFEVLCVDGVMPGVPTSAVIDHAERERPGIRVLLCSGYLPEDLLRRGVRAGRYAYLQKPFTAAELVASVRGVLAAPPTSART